MASIVLRVAGPDFDVDSFLRSHPEIVAEAIWHIGESRIPRRKPSTTSGFNFCLGDDDSDVVALDRARGELSRLRLALENVRELGVRACMDVGLFVSSEFSKNFHLSLADLRLLVDLGVEVEVSAYPCTTESAAADMPD